MSSLQVNPVVHATAKPVVIPYYLEKDNLPKDILALIYRRLVAEGLDQELLHGSGILVNEAEFVRFVSTEALASLFLDLNGSYAGIAWLQHVEQTETLLKGCAAIAVFREYQYPRISEAFGAICLDQWFNRLGLDLVYGITPKPNRLARRYTVAVGFRYVATVPGFVSYHGKTVDALIAVQTKDEFNRRSYGSRSNE